MADVATGTTVVFGTTGYTLEKTKIGIGGRSVEVIDVTHLGSVEYREKLFGALKNSGQLKMTGYPDLSSLAPLGVTETITINWASGVVWTFSGAIVEDNTDANLEEAIVADVVVEITGGITVS